MTKILVLPAPRRVSLQIGRPAIFLRASRKSRQNQRTIPAHWRSLPVAPMNGLPETLKLSAFAPLTAEHVDEGTRAAKSAQHAGRDTRHRAAVERMMERHGRLVYRVAFAVVRNAADAEDVVQETFLQMLRGSPERAAEIADERGYLARAAWRLACRGECRRRPSLVGDVLWDVAATGETPEQAAIQSDLEAWLHRRIDELPEKLRQPLALAALGELSSPQIAAVLGIPEGTVRRRIHTARQLLRQQLETRKGGAR
jgi:RNA polymerase sigma-70 factor (ECF subfamily)